MLVSVIITVYNKVEYIEQCLRSVLEQTYNDIEIIVVNDGSTDGSERICNNLKRQDHRIKVYTQERQGLVKSRKFGASMADVEFILFVDGDDWIDQEMIESLVKKQKENDADVVLCNYYNYRGEILQSKKFALSDGFYSIENDADVIFGAYFKIDTNYATMHNICEKLIRKSVFCNTEELVDDSVTRAEDLVLSYGLLHLCVGIQVVNKPMYFYRWVDNSMIHNIDVSILNDVEKSYQNIVDIRTKLGSNACLEQYINQFYRRWIDNLADQIWGNATIRYLFPYECIEKNAKIILYGMGKVGQSYRRQVEEGSYCKLVGVMDSQKWIDGKNTLDEINKNPYDYVVISVMSEDSAKDIKMTLINKGVSESKIVWKKPVLI